MAQLNPNMMRAIYGMADKRTQARMRAASKDVLVMPAPSPPQQPKWQRLVRQTMARITKATIDGGVARGHRLSIAYEDLERMLAKARQVPFGFNAGYPIGKKAPLSWPLVNDLDWYHMGLSWTPRPNDPYQTLVIYLDAVNKEVKKHAAARGLTPAQRSRLIEERRPQTSRRLEQAVLLSANEVAKRAAARRARRAAGRATRRYGQRFD